MRRNKPGLRHRATSAVGSPLARLGTWPTQGSVIEGQSSHRATPSRSRPTFSSETQLLREGEISRLRDRRRTHGAGARIHAEQQNVPFTPRSFSCDHNSAKAMAKSSNYFEANGSLPEHSAQRIRPYNGGLVQMRGCSWKLPTRLVLVVAQPPNARLG